jgi:hypothetical protein
MGFSYSPGGTHGCTKGGKGNTNIGRARVQVTLYADCEAYKDD